MIVPIGESPVLGVSREGSVDWLLCRRVLQCGSGGMWAWT